eukprot:281179-Amorphochlora_amoeboformis.AAC.1
MPIAIQAQCEVLFNLNANGNSNSMRIAIQLQCECQFKFKTHHSANDNSNSMQCQCEWQSMQLTMRMAINAVGNANGYQSSRQCEWQSMKSTMRIRVVLNTLHKDGNIISRVNLTLNTCCLVDTTHTPSTRLDVVPHADDTIDSTFKISCFPDAHTHLYICHYNESKETHSRGVVFQIALGWVERDSFEMCDFPDTHMYATI